MNPIKAILGLNLDILTVHARVLKDVIFVIRIDNTVLKNVA